MTIAETVDHFAKLAKSKFENLKNQPTGFYLSSMMAGAYVGVGIILIFSVGQNADPSVRNLMMGGSFGIALTFVVFAGSELFTGHTMYGAIGWLTGVCRTGEILKCWAATWLGNLGGSFAIAGLFVIGGGGVVLHSGGQDLLHLVAEKKINSSAIELVARGMLCNWLVCLALWTSARTQSDAAKCILIFWCLFAFIAAGFEHSVANMTVFSLALLSEHSDKISLLGAGHNLLWVTVGNTLSGAIVMGVGYWCVAGSPKYQSSDQPSNSL